MDEGEAVVTQGASGSLGEGCFFWGKGQTSNKVVTGGHKIEHDTVKAAAGSTVNCGLETFPEGCFLLSLPPCPLLWQERRFSAQR